MADLRALYDEFDGDQFSLAYTGGKGTVTVSWCPAPELEDDDTPQPRPPRTKLDQWKAEAGA